jgi:hypothetical protein
VFTTYILGFNGESKRTTYIGLLDVRGNAAGRNVRGDGCFK